MADAQQSGASGNEGVEAAGKALVSAMVTAVTQPEPMPDPLVSVAFGLGWHIAELYQPASWPSKPPARGVDLPGLGSLSAAERALVGLSQIDVALNQLKSAITEQGLTGPTTVQARHTLEAGAPTDEAFRNQIFDLHLKLLAVLTAASFKLGKAYGLGRALADTTRQPHDIQTVKHQLAPHRVATIKAWLDDLTSVLPAHAGHAVGDSLEQWREWAEDTPPKLNAGEDITRALRLLRRQGERWRGLLSGEKRGVDALSLEDYVYAGSDALKQAGALVWRFLGRFAALLLLALVLFAGGVWLILSDSNAAHIAAGLAGILASLGITWKGVGGSLGTTAGKLERPIWEAALDAQIAQALTLRPGSKQVVGYTAPGPAPEPQAQHRSVRGSNPGG
ncbi:MAG TPA: hypothetical protein VKG38_18715 [Solirubrobacteraceae bacterium]|nr:hypothetical protein [Solirubrobacteraceae bacterium]